MKKVLLLGLLLGSLSLNVEARIKGADRTFVAEPKIINEVFAIKKNVSEDIEVPVIVESVIEPVEEEVAAIEIQRFFKSDERLKLLQEAFEAVIVADNDAKQKEVYAPEKSKIMRFVGLLNKHKKKIALGAVLAAIGVYLYDNGVGNVLYSISGSFKQDGEGGSGIITVSAEATPSLHTVDNVNIDSDNAKAHAAAS